MAGDKAPASNAAKGDDNKGGQAADRDRVVMASRAPDGTPLQHDPELIGPKDDAIAGARKQLVEQAVSVTDQRQTREDVDTRRAADDEQQDPAISARREEHEAAAKAAAKAAEAEVSKLHAEGK